MSSRCMGLLPRTALHSDSEDYQLDRVRHCQLARVRHCQLARVRHCQLARVRYYQLDRVRHCQLARVRHYQLERVRHCQLDRVRHCKQLLPQKRAPAHSQLNNEATEIEVLVVWSIRSF
jgi:hypothetical protein